MCRLSVMFCVFVGVSSSVLAQTTLVVDRDGHASASNCNESAAAFPTVGGAIAAAASGDTILVCPGTYVENINFSGKSIVVRSTEGPAATILDGNAIDSVVRFTSHENSTTVLAGFTIRNGRARDEGGGIRINEASPTIRRNVIINNVACTAGGISIMYGSPLVEYNTIANNTYILCLGSSLGGGIGIHGDSQAVIRHNNIYGNTAGPGGVGAIGGGIGLWSVTSPTIEFNVIWGNVANQGGGIAIFNPSPIDSQHPLIVGNLIVRNKAAYTGGGIYWRGTGGPLLLNNTIADNDGNTIADNDGLWHGSGVVAGSSATIWNNIIVAVAGQTAVLCSDEAGNEEVPTFWSNNVFSVSGTTYEGLCTDQTGLDGNISADPLFTGPATNDYHLLPNSPCIDAGDDAATGLPATDLDGHARILDGNGDTLAVVDIGADEAPATGTAPGSFAKSSPADAAQGLPSAVALTWDASAGATGYEYCIDAVDNNACDGTWVPVWNATSATIFGLEGVTTYYWQVRAINSAGVTYANNGDSAYWNFTTEVLTRIIGLSGDLNFGTILAGQSVTRTLTITNSGNDFLTVSGFTYPSGFDGFWSGTVAPGRSRSVAVTFRPNSQGTYSGTIKVMADQTGGTSSIVVSGTALPVIRIMGLSGDLAFGTIPAASSATRALTISNQGTDALTVSNILYPTGFSGAWSGSLAPGESHTVSVTFTPTVSAVYGGVITVVANQTVGGSTIATSGRGAVPTGTQVVWQHAAGSLAVWYVQGATVTATLYLNAGQVVERDWQVVGTGDLNGDGMPDLVWQHVSRGWLGVWFMNGNAVTSTETLSIDHVTDLNWVIRAVGDIDGDGHADLIWQHRTGGWIAAWLMNGAQVVGTTLLSIPQIPVEWEVVGAGDLNGDRKADLVFQHRTNGWLAAWYLTGSTVTGTELLSVSQMTDPAWHVRGVGDCDGDGRADLLWQNDTNGSLGVWFLIGTTVVGQSTLSQPRVDVEWRMVGPG